MICVSIIAGNTAEALEKAKKAEALADIIEIRLDLMDSFALSEMIPRIHKPVIATYRSLEESGRGTADYGTRIRYLMDAVEAGADFVDVEYRTPPAFRDDVLKNKGKAKVIVSCHLSDGTPSMSTLEDYLTKMAATGADIVKIVPLAKKREDNLRVLRLIPRARRSGVGIITFCMGPMGVLSRIISPLLGGYLTFASLDEGQAAGYGQVPASKMRRIWEDLSGCT